MEDPRAATPFREYVGVTTTWSRTPENHGGEAAGAWLLAQFSDGDWHNVSATG